MDYQVDNRKNNLLIRFGPVEEYPKIEYVSEFSLALRMRDNLIVTICDDVDADVINRDVRHSCGIGDKVVNIHTDLENYPADSVVGDFHWTTLYRAMPNHAELSRMGLVFHILSTKRNRTSVSEFIAERPILKRFLEMVVNRIQELLFHRIIEEYSSKMYGRDEVCAEYIDLFWDILNVDVIREAIDYIRETERDTFNCDKYELPIEEYCIIVSHYTK